MSFGHQLFGEILIPVLLTNTDNTFLLGRLALSTCDDSISIHQTDHNLNEWSQRVFLAIAERYSILSTKLPTSALNQLYYVIVCKHDNNNCDILLFFPHAYTNSFL